MDLYAAMLLETNDERRDSQTRALSNSPSHRAKSGIGFRNEYASLSPAALPSECSPCWLYFYQHC